MAADANVFARFLGPAKSMADFQAEDLALQDAAVKAQGNRMALEDAQQQRQRRNALDALVRGAYQSGNPIEALLKSGDPDAIQMGQKMQGEQAKAQQDAAKVQSEAALKKAQAFAAQLGAMKQYAGAIAANPSPEYAMSALDEYARATGMDVSADRQALSRMQPEQIRQWALGKAGQVDAILPKWQQVQAGDRVEFINQNAATQQPIQMGVNPAVAAQGAQQERNNRSREAIAAADRAAADQRAAQKAAAPKPALPAAAMKQQQELIEKIGTANSINADLAALDGQIESGKLDLGPLANLVNRGRNAIGMSSEQSRNLATLNSTLEKIRNDSLRLNSGVQTEGDAQRAWNELVTNINDPKLVQTQLRRIQELNKRAAELQKLQIELLRANFNAGPLDTTAAEQQPAAVGRGDRTPVKTGVEKSTGRRVIQYSDGTVEYAK